MAFFLTRLQVGDYDRWKPMFDEDGPGVDDECRATAEFQHAEQGQSASKYHFSLKDDVMSDQR